MTKPLLLKVFAFVLLLSPAYGQKVKYKDIWGLLNTKQYEAAEPFLKKYLQENIDNPNAFLYMGIIYQEKSLKDDVLKQTRRVIATMDSSILYYDKAYKAITEKEIKRNSEFYQAYNRRDLRTGEFGVKLSDIQFDLEKKMEGLRERIDRVKMVKYYFALSDSLYKKSNTLFKSLQSVYPGQKELYLRADKNTLATLATLVTRFDSCTKAFDNYKSSASTIGKIGYNHSLSLEEITDFKKDGTSATNFYQDDLKLWDYKQFANKSKQIIEGEIMPMRDHLVAYDIEINKLREKLSHDSLSVRNDLTSLIDKLLMERLKKYDQEPLPMEVFTLKIADLEYRSSVLENKSNPDSTNVHLRLSLLKKELTYLNKLDSTATRLQASDLESKSADYDYFVKNTYNNTAVLKSFISGLKEYAEREKKIKTTSLAKYNQALQWLVVGADSIPLMQEGTDSKFKPLVIIDEKYTAGLHYTDSLNPTGYLYTINPSRVPDVKVIFPVEKQSFKQARLLSSKAVSFSDTAGQIYFVLIFSDRGDKDKKFAATLAKIYRSDGLAWSMNYQLDFIPKEILFKAESGELTVRGGDNQQNTMDKNGKLMK
ncbi:MAG: hypothetical protein C0490_04825 [Marivirga sp.]|nr:hypothetical protein [Marivirga sp.]